MSEYVMARSTSKLRKMSCYARQYDKCLIANRINILVEALNRYGIELVTDDSPSNIRRILETAGNKMGSVHFIKRSNGELRKMSYRLHVTNPKHAKKPTGKINRKGSDMANHQMTVFDTNKVIWDNGKVLGRGAWRTIPLENVVRIVAGGKIYFIMPYGKK